MHRRKPTCPNRAADEVVAQGYKLPASTSEWGDFDYIGSSGPWVSKEKEAFFESFKFYLKLGFNKTRFVPFPLRYIGRWRCKTNNFKFPIEKLIIEKIRPKQRLS